MKPKNKHISGLGVYNFVLAFLMLAPLIMIVWTSFTPTEYYAVPTGQWSLKWYGEMLRQTAMIKALGLSAFLAIVAGAIAIVIGFLASFALVRYDFPGKSALEAFFTLPIVIPAVVIGLALLMYFAQNGLYNSFFGLMMTHALLVLPYVVKNCSNSLRTVSKDMELAAMNMGAHRWQAFIYVTAPLIQKGLMSAFLFSFLVSFSEVTVTLFITGPDYQTLPVRLYNFMLDINTPLVAAISATLLFLSALVMIILERLVGLKNLI